LGCILVRILVNLLRYSFFTWNAVSYPVFKKPWVRNFVGREALNVERDILEVSLAYKYTFYNALIEWKTDNAYSTYTFGFIIYV